MKFNGHEMAKSNNGGILKNQRNADVVRNFIRFKRVYGKPVTTFIKRTRRGNERATYFMMRRFPKFFTQHSLRSKGLTRKGVRRLRK